MCLYVQLSDYRASTEKQITVIFSAYICTQCINGQYPNNKTQRKCSSCLKAGKQWLFYCWQAFNITKKSWEIMIDAWESLRCLIVKNSMVGNCLQRITVIMYLYGHGTVSESIVSCFLYFFSILFYLGVCILSHMIKANPYCKYVSNLVP